MNNYNFELANNSYAQKILKFSGATGVGLFLFNNRFEDERAISFLHQTHLASGAIDEYRKGLFRYDTFLSDSSQKKLGRTPYLNTKRKRNYLNSSGSEKIASNNRKYWQTLGSFGYEETGAMIQQMSPNVYMVIGLHIEDHRRSLVLDKTLATLEAWITEASDYIVDQSVEQFQGAVDKQAPAYDLDKNARRLTNRELQVVCEVLKGKSNKQIAAELTLSGYTVDNHLRRIYRKFDVHSRTSLAAVLTAQHRLST